jgi:hypothetical protein
MIDNYGNPIDIDRPTTDNYGNPIDYNCHACDAPLSWFDGDWNCLFCEPSDRESYEDFYHNWSTACRGVDEHE